MKQLFEKKACLADQGTGRVAQSPGTTGVAGEKHMKGPERGQGDNAHLQGAASYRGFAEARKLRPGVESMALLGDVPQLERDRPKGVTGEWAPGVRGYCLRVRDSGWYLALR